MMKIFPTTLSGLLLFLFTLSICAQPTDNVIAYYPFNGNAYDVTGSGNHAVVSSATLTADRLGKPNACYYFNGSGALLTLPNLLLPGNTAFSFVCWFKPMGNTLSGSIPGQGIIDLRGQYQIALAYNQSNNTTNPGSIVYTLSTGSSSTTIVSSNNSIQLNNWYHFACNFGDHVMELYLNGKLIGSKMANPPDAVSGYNNIIGKDYNLAQNRCWANGNIDEVIFYKRKLSAAEILAIYNKENTQSELPTLYEPVSYGYDATGNRLSRNFIFLKKAAAITQFHDSLNACGTVSGKITPFHLDSLSYNDLDQKIRIYPNPTRGLLYIQLTAFDPAVHSVIKVYDPRGILVVKHDPASCGDVIDLSGYANGLYIMQISVGSNVSEWKILKD